jgi:hypothetical protein
MTHIALLSLLIVELRDYCDLNLETEMRVSLTNIKTLSFIKIINVPGRSHMVTLNNRKIFNILLKAVKRLSTQVQAAFSKS